MKKKAKKKKPAKKPKIKTGDVWVSVAVIDAKETTKTITPGSLTVYRKSLVVWIVNNKEASTTLTVGIDNFVPVPLGGPSKPVLISGPVNVAAGKTGVISAYVQDVGKGKDLTYKYNVIINDNVIDPEIVVCDDPDPQGPGPH